MLYVPVLDPFPANAVCSWLPLCNEFHNILTLQLQSHRLTGIPWTSGYQGGDG